jgi:hypothetical protein
MHHLRASSMHYKKHGWFDCIFLLTIIFGTMFLLGYMLATLYMDIVQQSGEDETSSVKKKEFCNKYLDEVRALPASTLTDDEVRALYGRFVTMELPLNYNKVIHMTYNHSRNAFCYYASSDVVYKYANVAARLFVITYQCKQLYLDADGQEETTKDEPKEAEPKDETKDEVNKHSVFVHHRKPVKKVVQVNSVNHLIHVGNLTEYENMMKPPAEVKKIDITTFLKMQKEKQY